MRSLYKGIAILRGARQAQARRVRHPERGIGLVFGVLIKLANFVSTIDGAADMQDSHQSVANGKFCSHVQCRKTTLVSAPVLLHMHFIVGPRDRVELVA